jgi:hypothetical protein
MVAITPDKERQMRAVRTVLDAQAIRPEPDGGSFITLTFDDVEKLCHEAYLVGFEHAAQDAQAEVEQLTEERDHPRPMGR